MLIGENYVITRDYNSGQLEILIHSGHPFTFIIAYKFFFYLLMQVILASLSLLIVIWLLNWYSLSLIIALLLFVVLIAGNLFMFFAMTLGYANKFLVSLLLIPINLPYTLLFLLSLNESSYLWMMSGIALIFTPALIYCSALVTKEAVADR